MNLNFNWPGYIFGDLLVFLQQNKQIDLLTSDFNGIANWISEKRTVSVMIFTIKHKKEYLENLSLENFNEKELIEFNKEFSENDDPELAKAEINGIRALQKSLQQLENENDVIILTVG